MTATSPLEQTPTPPADGFARPRDLAAALALLAEQPRTVLAGGTDLFPATRAPQLSGAILDITDLAALKGVARRPDGVRIGAAVTWRELIAADLPPAFDALKAAAREVGGKQIQAAGTLGGNLCNASPAADGAPPLLALDAEIELASAARGARRLPLAAFLAGPRRTLRAPDELLVAVHVPAAALGGVSRFAKLGARAYLVISIAMAAARVRVEGGRIAEAALALGACSAVAQRLGAAEARLLGQPATPAALAAAIGDLADEAAVQPIDDIRASAAYRRRAAAEIVRRAALAALAATDGGRTARVGAEAQ